MNYADLFQEDLVQINSRFADKEELFEEVFHNLMKKNLVANTFLKAVKKREVEYPTGLEFENIAIAIPHTDVEHILEPFIYVCTLEDRLKFIQMGTSDIPVNVEAVLILGIKDSKEQVGMLSGLMAVFSNQEFIERFKKASSKEEIVTLLKGQMETVVK